MLKVLTPGPRQLLGIDVVLALCMTGVVALAALDAETPVPAREPAWLSWLLSLAIAGPIAVRRRWPLPALTVAMAATTLGLSTALIPFVAMGAPLAAVGVTMYLVGLGEPRQRSTQALAVCLLVFDGTVWLRHVVSMPPDSWGDAAAGAFFGTMVLLMGWALGLTARARQSYAEEAAKQATRQAVAEERLRIARELHDIVAHSMSLIAVKAGIGNHVAETHPGEARAALRVIESTSRASLAEMRHLLGVLRSDVDDQVLAPAPGLAALSELASRAADAGVSVTVDVRDGTLPESVGLSVYRIVQESVTNVVRHAAPARCQVVVEPNGEEVRVEVSNDGPVVRAEPHAGHGLIGMRERVAMYGGTFAAGPRPGGGFQVTASIPYGST